MTFKYIGSKARLLSALSPFIGSPNSNDGFFADLFCGTGSVAQLASQQGWPVWINDSLHSAVIMAAARIVSANQVSYTNFGGYNKVLELLNQRQPIPGFIWREYSPASLGHCGVERRYFTEENAGRLDAMRAQISEWKSEGMLTELEQTVLIADLLSAANRAANIAGTYGCFLSKWQRPALQPIGLVERSFAPAPVRVQTSVLDVFSAKVGKTDTVYLDPPYTKRQYASYYHVLETLALNDEPPVEGVCGLRPWKEKASAFCYKTRALTALTQLMESLEAKQVFLSYSNQGHVNLDELISVLERSGDVELIPLVDIGRYRPNLAASTNGAGVTEYLVRYKARTAAKRVAAAA